MCVHVEKQSPEVFYKKRFSENFAKVTCVSINSNIVFKIL